MRAAFDFAGGVVMITGAANGIGAAAARACAAAGATVIAADVDEQALAALAAEAVDLADQAGEIDTAVTAEGRGEGAIETVRLDVSDAAAVVCTVEEVLARHGRIDALVCGAVVQPLGRVLEMDPELFLRTQAVNLNGLVWCCRAVAPAMVAQGGGTIVAFASGTAVTGKAGSAAYTSSKGGVLGFVKTLALELRDDNVRVNILRPGVVDTPQFRNSNPRGGPPIPLDSPEDVVGPLLFLLSEQATMTGSTVAREMPFPATKAAVR